MSSSDRAEPCAMLWLEELAGFVGDHDKLEVRLAEAADAICATVGGRSCSVMLCSAEAGEPRLVLMASHGLPASATGQTLRPGERIAGEVARTGVPLLIEDMKQSAWSEFAHKRRGTGRGAICVPLKLADRVFGVVSVSGPAGRGLFGDKDLRTVQAFAELLVRTIQAVQLRKILDSRFAQIALAESHGRHAGIMEKSMPPEKAAHIIAKSLFRQMTLAGFTDNQIIRTASNIIEELSESKRKGGQPA
jgi:L-methionine (R)-S-oxide reductase